MFTFSSVRLNPDAKVTAKRQQIKPCSGITREHSHKFSDSEVRKPSLIMPVTPAGIPEAFLKESETEDA